MRLNKESLAGVTDEKLRVLWDMADDKPGAKVGGLSEGAIAEEVNRRRRRNILSMSTPMMAAQSEPFVTAGQNILRSRRRQPFHSSFHPIDGSWWMMEQGRRGAIIARSRR